MKEYKPTKEFIEDIVKPTCLCDENDTVNMTQEEQNKRLVESLEQLSQALRSMGQTADTLCEALGKLLKFKDA